MELAARKIPVIVCGEAWIKNKGISFDPETVDEYVNILQSNSYEMTRNAQTRVAFAYHSLSVQLLIWRSKNKADLVIDKSNLGCIIDGNSDGLELICKEIISYRGQFIGAFS